LSSTVAAMTDDVSAAFKRYFVQSRRSSGSNAFASPINIKKMIMMMITMRR